MGKVKVIVVIFSALRFS